MNAPPLPQPPARQPLPALAFSSAGLPPFPAPLAGLPPLPGQALLLAPLSALCSRLVRSVLARHPGVLHRMGSAAGSRYLIDLADTPLLVLIEPLPGRARLMWRNQPPPHDAAIVGRLPAFLSMLHAGEDGDALFFSGALMIRGDTAAVLALRNALDDAELDLTEELAALGTATAPLLLRLGRLAERCTGLALSRRAPGAGTALVKGWAQ